MIEGDLFKSLFDVIPFDVYVVDIAKYEIIYMNRKMIENRGDYIGGRCYQNIYGEAAPCRFCRIREFLSETQKYLMEKTLVFELFNPVDDRWYQIQEKVMTWPDGRMTKYSIAVDISQLKETQNRLSEAHAELALKNKALEKLSITDGLTGLYNRLRIDELLENAIYSARRYSRIFSVIMIDIDHFKNINDSYGHLAGDEALRRLADIFRKRLRKSDFAGRWGGEEFVVVSEDTDEDSGVSLAEKLREETAAADFGEAGDISISVGVTSFRTDDDRDSLIRRVDAALYKAKARGRNRVERAETDT